MALRFLNAWGCEVTAFSTSADKEAEACALGADHFVNTRDEGALARLAGSFHMILVTVNVELDWESTSPLCARAANCTSLARFPPCPRRFFR